MVIRVVMSGTFYGQVCQNVLHFHKVDGVWPAQVVTLLADLRDNWLSGTHGVRTEQNDRAFWTEIRAYNCDTPTLTPLTLTISLQGTDGNASTQLLSYVCYILRLRASSGGRKGRGRIYIPGPRFGYYINGSLSASAITALNQVTAQLAKYLDGGASPWTVGISPRGTGEATDFIPASTMQFAPISGVQRRRNIGVGV